MQENRDLGIIKKEEESRKMLEQNKKLFKRYLSFFVVAFIIVASFYIGFNRGKNYQKKNSVETTPLIKTTVKNKFPLEEDDKKVDFSLFWRVWDLVKEKHISKDTLNAQKMVYGAINGMLRATDDPYSNFFNPEESKSFSQDIEGSFDGIGAELGIKDDILTVIAPLEDSPAQKAGLRAGDKIIKINDKMSTDYTIDQAVEMVRGKKGTGVKLTVLHPGEQETTDVTVMRDTIEIKSVKIEFKDNEVAYVKLTKFSDNTTKEFNATADQILTRNAKGIILDLRNNPGGLLDKSIAIASRMIPKDKVVVSEEDSKGKKDSLKTTGGDKLSGIPTVVLINEGSASASEILAGALKDDQGITLIGKKSFGKGSVQELVNLPGGSSVKITVAKWLTPSGQYIMDKGIQPDIEVDLTSDDYKNNRDPQLEKALEVIGQRIK